jgi:hypothetical protein
LFGHDRARIIHPCVFVLTTNGTALRFLGRFLPSPVSAGAR